MQSAPSSQEADPNEIVPENEELVGYVYKRVVREVLARIDQRLAELEKQAARDVGEGRSSGRTGLLGGWAVRGAIGLLVVIGVAGAAGAAWYWSDNDSARNFVARWAPSTLLTSKDSQASKEDTDATQPSSPGVQQATTGAASGQPASPAQQAPDNEGRETVGTVGRSAMPASSDELAPLVQKMARDIANLGQGIEQLRMSQDQMNRDNATAVQQLQAGQDQLVRLVKQPVQNPQPKNASPPQRTTTATRPPRRPQQPSGFLFRRPT